MQGKATKCERRTALQILTSGGLIAATGLTPRRTIAAEVDGPAPLNRFPRMMQRFLVDRVREAHQRSVDAKAALATKQDAEQYVASVQRRIAECFGPTPERTPLDAQVTGVLNRSDYSIEKVIFHSRPNFPVTANLYLPDTKDKVPGVVGTCGHSTNGKAAESYQSFAQGLARQGYACLIFDPIGQGERLQYPKAGNRSRVGIGVREHIHSGNQQYLVGENLAMWRAWDGIRALDYLLSRDEVDNEHIGVTGNSGGGTMTTWLCGVERRWTMAAPSCFVTTFLRNAENELPADTEQCPPRVLAMGLEHEDFIIAQAPNPIVLLAKEMDFFDVRGAEAAFERIQHVYHLLGAEDKIELFVGPTEHGFSIENREAMYRCFNRATGSGGSGKEPKLVIEADGDLWCTKSGQVDERKPATVFTFTAELSRTLATNRKPIAPNGLPGVVENILKLPRHDAADVPSFRILRDFGGRGYPRPAATTYAVETERDVFALCYRLSGTRLLSRPPENKSGSATLYISNRSADEEMRTEAWVREQIESTDGEVFAVDVRGIGESLPNTCGIDSFDNSYGCDYFYAAHSIMLDRPYLGQKVFDVLQTIRLLESTGAESVHLVGASWGGLIATLAAVVCPQVATVTVKQRIDSFEQLATTEHYDMPLAYLPPGVLKAFDLPDCDKMLADKLRRDA